MFCEVVGSVLGRGEGSIGSPYEPPLQRTPHFDSKNFFYEFGYRYSGGIPISLNGGYGGSHFYPTPYSYVSNADNLMDLIDQFQKLSVTPLKVRKIPPRTYTCHLCHQKGHYIKDCVLISQILPLCTLAKYFRLPALNMLKVRIKHKLVPGHYHCSGF